MSANISEKENQLNLEDSDKVGGVVANRDKYQVIKQNFDELQNFEDGSFDLILSNDALLHAQDHAKTAKEMARMLKKGGILVFSDLL